MVISEAEKREADRRLTGREPALYAEINRLLASNKELVEALELALGVLPDSKHNDQPCWDWCWDELDCDAQDAVTGARQAGNAAIANARRLG